MQITLKGHQFYNKELQHFFYFRNCLEILVVQGWCILSVVVQLRLYFKIKFFFSQYLYFIPYDEDAVLSTGTVLYLNSIWPILLALFHLTTRWHQLLHI